MNGDDDLARLEGRLRYVFKDRRHLVRALTHASLADDANDIVSNERLEFLGDRVLGLLAADTLIARFPNEAEGALAQRLNALVRRERCALIAQNIGLGAHVRMAEAEARSGGREKPAILADACEALLGALYLDGGLTAARALFEAEWASALEAGGGAPRDAKSRLQEWTQERGLGLPLYRAAGRSGPDHRPLFRIEASIENGPRLMAEGPSKRVAEQLAAAAILKALGVDFEDDGLSAGSGHAA